MLYINGTHYDRNTNVSNLIGAIKSLPSTFSNLEENEFHNGSQAQEVVAKEIRRKLEYLSDKNIKEILLLQKKILTEFQGKFDNEAYMVAQGEVGFSASEKIGTANLTQCVGLIIHDIKSKKTALAHIDIYVSENDLNNILKYMPIGNKKIILIGAMSQDSEIVSKILKVILDYNYDVYIDNSNIFSEKQPTAIVVDPLALTVRYLTPKIQREKPFDHCSTSRLPVYQYLEGCDRGGYDNMEFNNKIDIAFDLTINKSYFPIEVNMPFLKNIFDLEYVKLDKGKVFYKLEFDEQLINSYINKYSKMACKNGRASAISQACANEKLLGIIELYYNAINSMISEIAKSIPKGKLKATLRNNIIEVLVTKKIFIGSGSEHFNQQMVDSIKNELSKFPSNAAKREVNAILENLRAHEVPYSIDLCDINKCKKLQELFIEKPQQLVTEVATEELGGMCLNK